MLSCSRSTSSDWQTSLGAIEPVRQRICKTSTIGGTTSRLAIIGFAVALSLWGISACSGFWNTPVQMGKLLVSDVVVTGSSGYVLISVADMPTGGVASIEFGLGGNEAITFTNITASAIAIEGKSGFTVLAEDFTTNAGKGTLLAANGSTGVASGQILKITFAVTAANPTFTVDTTKVEIGSDTNALITAWETGSLDYYTK